MDKNLLWEGRPSFWVATGTFYKLFKTIIVCAIVLYLTKYLPAWNIPVPKIIPVPESIAQFGGIVFYILVYFVCLFVIRLKGFIKLLLEIFCMDINLTDERLSFRSGIFNKFKKKIELYKIKDLSLYEPLFYRIMGIQNINIVAADHTIRFPRLQGVPKKADLYELLSHHVELAREKKGVKDIDYFNK